LETDCGVPTLGACCSNGQCALKSEQECSDSSGEYFGVGVPCAAVNCGSGGEVIGACCLSDGSCTELDAFACAGLSGSYSGDNSTCAETACGNTGACCSAGDCSVTTVDLCDGDYVPGEVCPVPCGENGLLSACCFANGSCQQLAESDCQTQGGVSSFFQTCGDVDCDIANEGACCLPGQQCEVYSQSECSGFGGVWSGPGSVCETNPCGFVVLGACCIPGLGCVESLSEDSCSSFPGGTFAGGDTDCSDGNSNGTPDVCE
jgi:hypothetical protein